MNFIDKMLLLLQIHRLIAIARLSTSVNSSTINCKKQEGQHPLTGQRAANFRLLANQ